MARAGQRLRFAVLLRRRNVGRKRVFLVPLFVSLFGGLFQLLGALFVQPAVRVAPAEVARGPHAGAAALLGQELGLEGGGP